MALKECLRAHEAWKALLSLPPTLDETYKRILLGIPTSRRVLAARLLMWVAFTPEPLRVEGLAEAIVLNWILWILTLKCGLLSQRTSLSCVEPCY